MSHDKDDRPGCADVIRLLLFFAGLLVISAEIGDLKGRVRALEAKTTKEEGKPK